MCCFSWFLLWAVIWGFWGLCKVPFFNLNWKSLNLGWTRISDQKTSHWREVHAWIWTHLLLEHSCKHRCVPCGDSSALPAHTKQWHGIVSLRKHRWHIQNYCKNSSKCAICWTASGRSHPHAMYSSLHGPATQQLAEVEVLHVKCLFFTTPFLMAAVVAQA